MYKLNTIPAEQLAHQKGKWCRVSINGKRTYGVILDPNAVTVVVPSLSTVVASDPDGVTVVDAFPQVWGENGELVEGYWEFELDLPVEPSSEFQMTRKRWVQEWVVDS